MQICDDTNVPFVAAFVKPDGKKTEQRRIIADYATMWVKYQHALGVKGCVVFDIDDTLIDGNQCVRSGFEFMVDFYKAVFRFYPVHIVTARPDDDHKNVMNLLELKGVYIPPDRLHMLPAHLWGEDTTHVEKFKWKRHLKFCEDHGKVVARLGDKLWDVAHINSLDTYLKHVDDRSAYIFFDPLLNGTLSAKLPG